MAHAFVSFLFGGFDAEHVRQGLGATRASLIAPAQATGCVLEKVRAFAIVDIREATVLKESVLKVMNRKPMAIRRFCACLVRPENSRQPTVLLPACPARPASSAHWGQCALIAHQGRIPQRKAQCSPTALATRATPGPTVVRVQRALREHTNTKTDPCHVSNALRVHTPQRSRQRGRQRVSDVEQGNTLQHKATTLKRIVYHAKWANFRHRWVRAATTRARIVWLARTHPATGTMRHRTASRV